MKILVISDLHVEFTAYQTDPAVAAATDVVVLAGDIHVGVKAVKWSRQTFPDKPIVLVAGNHEFYQGHWEHTLDEIREAALRHEVHFLENNAVTLNGVEFLGSTLWTDFAYFGADQTKQAMNEAKRYMMDYISIRGCLPAATLKRHHGSLNWLQATLASPGNPRSRVAVTHHYPHKQSTALQYQSDLCTAAFGSQLPEALFQQAGLWVHGHTHSSCRYEVNGCLVVCNPRGYPTGRLPCQFENEIFDPGLLIEQSPGGIGKCVTFEFHPQDGMTHPVETPEARLRDFLCNRQGQFDANMHAWLQQIVGDDARAMHIETETGQLPPMLQLALYCADQALKDEIAKQPDFAKQFLEQTHQTHDSLQSRYLRTWITELMDFARSEVGRDTASSVLAELICPRDLDRRQ